MGITSGTAPERGLNDGDRDGWIDGLCTNLARILRGRHAQALLDGESGPLPEGDLGLVELPIWLWRQPAINVGRKARPRNGHGSLLMPVRLHWVDGSVLRVLSAEQPEHQVAWVASGLGHTGTGRTTVTLGAGPDGTEDGLQHAPESAAAPLRRRSQVIARLEHLAADGKAARWEAMMEMESRIRWALDHANVAVSCEVNGVVSGLDETCEKLLDDTTISAIADGMLLGENDTEPGFAERLIDVCLAKTDVFAKVDPLKYIVTRTRSEAETAIRRNLGDPHTGRKLRALRRESGTSNLDTLLDLYKERYASDSMGRKRAAAAFTVAPSPMARRFAYLPDADDEHNTAVMAGMILSYEDELIERMDMENIRAIGA